MHWFIVGIFIPVNALLVVEKGLDLFQLGVVLAFYSGATLLLELPTGGLADSFGRKKVYLLSLTAQILAVVFLLLAGGFLTVAFSFLFLGVARALSSGSIEAWFVDEFKRMEPEADLQPVLARVGIFIPAGLGLGSLVGGVLPMTLGEFTARVGNFGRYGSNLLVMALMVGVHFLLTFLLVSEPEHPDRQGSLWVGFRKFPQVVSTSVQYGVKNSVVLLLLLTALAWGLGVSGVELFWQPQLKTILGSDSQTWVFGLLAAGYFFAASLGNVLSLPLCRLLKSNYPLVLFINRLLMGVFLFVLSLQFGISGFVVFYLVFFLFNGAAESPFLTIFNAQVPGRTRSTLLSFGSLVLQLGGMGGSLFLGYLARAFSITLAWIVGAGILSASSLLYLLLPRAERSERRRGSPPSE